MHVRMIVYCIVQENMSTLTSVLFVELIDSIVEKMAAMMTRIATRVLLNKCFGTFL